MAAPNLTGVLETVAHLDRNILRALANADVLVAHWYPADRTFAQLRRTLEDALVATRGLRAQVLRSAIDDVVLRENIFGNALAWRRRDYTHTGQDRWRRG